VVTRIRDVAVRWNRAVGLHSPTLGGLSAAVEASPTQVFTSVPDILYAGQNLLLRVHPGLPGSAIGDRTPALSVGLLVADDFLASNALVKPDRLPRFSMLQASLPCSAQAMLDHLQRVDPRSVSLATETKRWVVHYGKALSMVFRPEGSATTVGRDPSHSALVMVEFYFSLSYEALLPATVAEDLM
jgi:hypothetical protein